MTKQPLLVLFAAATLVTVSCKHADKTGVLVPKDAVFVLHINSSSLSSKLSWQEIRQNEWFQESNAGNNDSLARQLMNDPESSGIDTKGDITFFVKKQNQGGYTSIEGSVKDATVFESFNKKISKTTTAVVKKGDLNTLTLKDKVVVLWNKTHFIYVIDAPYINAASAYIMKNDNYTGPYSFPADSLQKFGTDVLSLGGDENLGSDDRFADLLKEKGEMHFWMNGEQYYNGLMNGMLSMMKIDLLFQGNATAATLNFENGAINFKVNQYFGKEMKRLVDKYPAKPVRDDILKRIPGNKIAGAIVFNYPPEGLKELLKMIGVDGVLNGFLGKNGFSLDEFVKANKGDVVFAVTDFEVKQPEVTIQPYPNIVRKEPSAKILFATSINDRAAFDRLISSLKSQIPDEAVTMTSKISFQLNNDWFAASNSPEQVNKFLAGGNNNNILASKIGGHPFGMYVDIHQLLTSSRTFMEDDSLSLAGMDASLRMWQDIVGTGGDKKGDALTSTFNVNLVDKNTNSLKQLNRYFDELGKINKARKLKYQQAF